MNPPITATRKPAFQDHIDNKRFAAGPRRFVGNEVAQQPGIVLARGALGSGVSIGDLGELVRTDIGQAEVAVAHAPAAGFTW